MKQGFKEWAILSSLLCSLLCMLLLAYVWLGVYMNGAVLWRFSGVATINGLERTIEPVVIVASLIVQVCAIVWYYSSVMKKAA